MLLRRQYLAANIGDQYHRLDWQDFRDEVVREDVDGYLRNWNHAKVQGMGLEFASPELGTGKTFAATYVAKELIKRGEKAYFIPFTDLLRLFEAPEHERREVEDRIRNCTVLVLDELLPYHSPAQGQFFARKFEELVRHRTNFNRVTFITTNLTPEQLAEAYPRPYSLLEAKNFRIILDGADYRRGPMKEKNIQMLLSGEIAPIT